MAYQLKRPLPDYLPRKCQGLIEDDPVAMSLKLAEFMATTEVLYEAAESNNFANFKGAINTLVIMTNEITDKIGKLDG